MSSSESGETADRRGPLLDSLALADDQPDDRRTLAVLVGDLENARRPDDLAVVTSVELHCADPVDGNGVGAFGKEDP